MLYVVICPHLCGYDHEYMMIVNVCRPVNVDAHFFGERDVVQLRNNLLDGQIQICAPEVLMLFTDNFDYQVRLSAPSCMCLKSFSSRSTEEIIICTTSCTSEKPLVIQPM